MRRIPFKHILGRFAGLWAFACLFTLAAQAAPTITVSASAVSILGTSQTISITCTLIDPNQTGNLRVSGTGVIPVMQASTVTPGATATVGPIYGNDVILDGFGNLNNTYYKVQVFTVTNGIIASTPSLQNFYAFIGSGTVDLATATPLAPSLMSGPLGVTIPGNLVATAGQNIANFYNINNVLWVDGNKYTTCDLAVAAAAAAQTIVVIPSTYGGANCSGPPFNVTIWDFRGGTGVGGNGGLQFNVTDLTGVQARLKVSQNPVNPLINTSYADGFFIEVVQGTLQSSNAAYDALACETDTAGTILSSATGRLSGCEATVALNSTGGNLFDARAVNINGRMTASNTTTLSNYEGLYSQTFVNSSAAALTNVYGALLEDQNAGSSNNLSLWAKGAIQIDKQALFDCSVSGTRCVVIQGNATGNNNELRIQNTAGSGHIWDFGEMQAAGIMSFRDITVASGPSLDFNLNAVTNGARTILASNATANRTFTFPDASANISYTTVLHTAYTNATTGFTTVTDGTRSLSFPVAANTDYTIDCHLYYQAAATGGLNIQFTGPAAPTGVRYAINAPLSVSTNNTATASAFSTSLGAVVTTATTDFDAAVTLGLSNGANAGTVIVQAKSSAAVNLTIQPGSYCQVQ